jgi:hypothetical protein
MGPSTWCRITQRVNSWPLTHDHRTVQATKTKNCTSRPSIAPCPSGHPRHSCRKSPPPRWPHPQPPHLPRVNSFAGFDFGRGQDRSKSAKDTFAYYGGANAGNQQWGTKAGAQDWFNEFIRPGLEDEGYQVGDVQGDKAFVHTRENPEGTWIDFVQGADGDNPMLAWQDESYGGGAMGGGGGSAAASALQGMPGGSDILAGLMSGDGMQSSDVMKQIQAELQKLLTGQAPTTPNMPLPQEAR